MSDQTNRVVTVEDLSGSVKTMHGPDASNHAGAFAKEVLSKLDATNCSDNLADGQTLEAPVFLDNEGPIGELPAFITRTNARDLFGLRSGETLSEAIARFSATKG